MGTTAIYSQGERVNLRKVINRLRIWVGHITEPRITTNPRGVPSARGVPWSPVAVANIIKRSMEGAP
jgi:hypothetical protein